MRSEEVAAAQRWFIERFVHSTATRNFCLRMHKLEPMTRDMEKKMHGLRTRNPAYDFHFTVTAFKIVVEPNTTEAAWVSGVIWYDEREQSFCYMTQNRVDLFTNLDT